MSTRIRGYLFALLAITIFSLQDAISKHLGASYPPIFITMVRFWAFAMFAAVVATRAAGSLKKAAASKRPWFQLMRGCLLASQIVLNIVSFTLIGLAHSQAIFAAGPIIVALLSMPLLGEKVGWRRWTAIIAGLFGVLVILKPGAGGFDFGALVALAAASIFALYVIATRYASRDDSAMTSFFYTGLGGALMTTLIGPFFWVIPAPADLAWLGLICMTGIASHWLLIRAYDILDAASVQPIMYLQLVFASVLGMTLFNETLTFNVVAGSVIVVAAGIFTVWRESVVARRTANSARQG